MTLRRIAARRCRVETIETLDALAFVEENHRQGASSKVEKLVSIGLYLDKELLGVAQFCYPRTDAMKREYTSELLRLAFKDNVRVMGGASKLVAHYKKAYKPSDVFTYQDATGELTNVYKHCGFTLVKQAKKKEYLVAPGKTLATGTRKEVLGMAYAVRYGPDRILGTKLGEIFSEDGSRKTNRALFVDELGWHVETTAGDRVYEWFNPDRTFYTYKITASDSDKYYYGVSHIKKANATMSECQRDKYMGSGGTLAMDNKFQHWKKKHYSSLQKEVLETFDRKARAYEAELRLIGDLYSTDPLCLNSCAGGRRSSPLPKKVLPITLKVCLIHGETKHLKDSCFTCAAAKRDSLKKCSIHGETNHAGEVCRKCGVEKIWNVKDCSQHGLVRHRGSVCATCEKSGLIALQKCNIHGETKHAAATCLRCSSATTHSKKECAVHGLVSHAGNSCSSCAAETGIKERLCSLHGVTKHRGEHCTVCTNGNSMGLKLCVVHGETKHRGATCLQCAHLDVITVNVCEIHGETKFRGNACATCSVGSAFTTQECTIHGMTTFRGKFCAKCQAVAHDSLKECGVHGITLHQGNACYKCGSAKSVSMKTCLIHGETSHVGDHCFRCMTKNSISLQTCVIHGEVNHRGKTCLLCIAEERTTEKLCKTHGLTKHQGNTCAKCSAVRGRRVGECEIHGMTNFNGKSCRKCSSEKTAHKRWHEKPKADCRFCLSALIAS